MSTHRGLCWCRRHHILHGLLVDQWHAARGRSVCVLALEVSTKVVLLSEGPSAMGNLANEPPLATMFCFHVVTEVAFACKDYEQHASAQTRRRIYQCHVLRSHSLHGKRGVVSC